MSAGDKNKKSALYQLTEQTLTDTVRFVFAATYDAEVISERQESLDVNSGQEPRPPECSSSLCRTVSSPSPAVSACFGLPCAMKVMGYFVNVVHKYTSESEQAACPPSPPQRSSSAPSGGAEDVSSPEEQSPTQDVQELVVALKTLQAIIWSDGDTGHCRGIVLRSVGYYAAICKGNNGRPGES